MQDSEYLTTFAAIIVSAFQMIYIIFGGDAVHHESTALRDSDKPVHVS